MTSANIILDESMELTREEIRIVNKRTGDDNIRGLAIYLDETCRTLATGARELAMDATYGTNSSGMDLFAVPV